MVAFVKAIPPSGKVTTWFALNVVMTRSIPSSAACAGAVPTANVRKRHNKESAE